MIDKERTWQQWGSTESGQFSVMLTCGHKIKIGDKPKKTDRFSCAECTSRHNETRVTDPVTGGQKGVKPERYELLPFEALDEVARVYAYGAKKYAPHNWRKGYAWGLAVGALLRHVSRWIQREDVDPESGCHHLAHAAFHCLTLIAWWRKSGGTDDRP